jgi:hypothetical protein
VTFVGGAKEPHTLTQDVAPGARLFDVEADPGATAWFDAPATPGVYPFHCLYHPGMRGNVTVSSAAASTPASTPTPARSPAAPLALAVLAVAALATFKARR